MHTAADSAAAAAAAVILELALTLAGGGPFVRVSVCPSEAVLGGENGINNDPREGSCIVSKWGAAVAAQEQYFVIATVVRSWLQSYGGEIWYV